jgi:predicted ester cyclase/heme-degrading monooxygenase HmoA
MGYSRIGVYQFKPGKADDAIRLAKQGLLPIFQKEPGFISYKVIKGPNDRGVSISVWDSREHAEAAEKRAADWVRENIQDVTQSSDIFLGELAFRDRAQGATTECSAVVREMQEAFNRKDLALGASFAAPNAKVLNTGFGQEMSYREYMQGWADAFPDAKVTEAKYIEQGDTVIAEFIGRGTQTGTLATPMGPLPPTNKRVEIRFVEVYEFRGGKVVAMRSYFDNASFMRQLGVEFQIQMPKKAAAPSVQAATQH